jgi:hypothetical protein
MDLTVLSTPDKTGYLGVKNGLVADFDSVPDNTCWRWRRVSESGLVPTFGIQPAAQH